jgi:prefoldin beta subunit
LKEDANVYKLIGPVLVKQDLAEAKANVKKRMEYISAELYVICICLFIYFV